eukprot:150881-Pleurochrysis_carterae.AAC.1
MMQILAVDLSGIEHIERLAQATNDIIRKGYLVAAEAAAAAAAAASTPSADPSADGEASASEDAQAEAESGSVTEQAENHHLNFEGTKKRLNFEHCPAESPP